MLKKSVKSLKIQLECTYLLISKLCYDFIKILKMSHFGKSRYLIYSVFLEDF